MLAHASRVSDPSAVDAGDLNRLIGDLSMARTTRVRVREQGGLGSQGSTINDGRSIHSRMSASTVLGQPATVFW